MSALLCTSRLLRCQESLTERLFSGVKHLQEPLGLHIYLESGNRESFSYHKTVLFIKNYEVIIKKMTKNPLFLHVMMQNVFNQAVCWFKSEIVICSPSYESIPTGQFTYQTVTMLSSPSQDLRCCMITAVFSRSEEADVGFGMMEASSFDHLVGREEVPSVFS